MIWELESVFLWRAGSEWSGTTEVWVWMCYCVWLLVTENSSQIDPNDEGDLWAHKVKIQKWEAIQVFDAVAQRFLKTSRFLPSVCSAFFCGSFSFSLWLASLLESRISKLLRLPHCPGKLEGWFWVALPGAQGTISWKPRENLSWLTDPPPVTCPVSKLVSLALGTECLCYPNPAP